MIAEQWEAGLLLFARVHFHVKKDHPYYEVIGELLKPMFHPCRNEQEVARLNVLPAPLNRKQPGPPNNNIHFIAGVRRLRINSPGSVETRLDPLPFKHRDITLTTGSRDSRQGLDQSCPSGRVLKSQGPSPPFFFTEIV
jgi:hypothetical protein